MDVVAVDVARGTPNDAKVFLDSHGATKLATYIDPQLTLMRAFGAYGLPLTILIDDKGREVARAVGPADWDAPESIDYFKALAAKVVIRPHRRAADQRPFPHRAVDGHHGEAGFHRILRRHWKRRAAFERLEQIARHRLVGAVVVVLRAAAIVDALRPGAVMRGPDHQPVAHQIGDQRAPHVPAMYQRRSVRLTWLLEWNDSRTPFAYSTMAFW